MKAKNFFKGPGIWIVVVIGMLLVAFATLAPGGAARIARRAQEHRTHRDAKQDLSVC